MRTLVAFVACVATFFVITVITNLGQALTVVDLGQALIMAVLVSGGGLGIGLVIAPAIHVRALALGAAATAVWLFIALNAGESHAGILEFVATGVIGAVAGLAGTLAARTVR